VISDGSVFIYSLVTSRSAVPFRVLHRPAIFASRKLGTNTQYKLRYIKVSAGKW